jgi:hypothetical protein
MHDGLETSHPTLIATVCVCERERERLRRSARGADSTSVLKQMPECFRDAGWWWKWEELACSAVDIYLPGPDSPLPESVDLIDLYTLPSCIPHVCFLLLCSPVHFQSHSRTFTYTQTRPRELSAVVCLLKSRSNTQLTSAKLLLPHGNRATPKKKRLLAAPQQHPHTP